MPDPLPGLVHDVQDALDRAHAAALAMDGAGLRRSLQAAASLLDTAVAQVEGSTAEAAGPTGLHEARAKVGTALQDLDAGKLAEMEPLLEEVREYLKGQ